MLPLTFTRVFHVSRNWPVGIQLQADFLGCFLRKFIGRVSKQSIVLIIMNCWHLFPLEAFKQKLETHWRKAGKEEVPFYFFPQDAIPLKLCFISVRCLVNILFSLQMLQHSEQAMNVPAPVFVHWTWVNTIRKVGSAGLLKITNLEVGELSGRGQE